MKLLKVLSLLVLTTVFVACSSDDDNGPSISVNNLNSNDASSKAALARLEFPKVKGGNSYVVIHSTNDKYGINYAVEWDKSLKSQRWSCYQMHAGNNGGNAGRYDTQTNGYPQDPLIPQRDRFASDPYWGSGYDHGHICPSADRQYSKEANMQTFYQSNMQPQRNVFNAGIWSKMEAQVRKWNINSFRDTLFVVKGGTIEQVAGSPIKDPIMKKLTNGLIVPKYFFMAVLCKKGGSYQAMGFWIQHYETEHKNDKLGEYVVNIRNLENMTGIDFFCNLPDDIENEVEKKDVATIKRLWGLTNN